MPYQGLVAGTRPATTLLPRLHTSTDFIRCSELPASFEQHDIFDVRGVGEHVDGLHSLHTVIGVEQRQVAGLRGGVATDVDDAAGRGVKDDVDHVGVHAGARRVGDDDVGPAMSADEVVGEDLTHVAGVELGVGDAVDAAVDLGILDGFGHVFNADDLRRLARDEVGDGAGTGVEVVDERFGIIRLTLEGEVAGDAVEVVGLLGVGLVEALRTDLELQVLHGLVDEVGALERGQLQVADGVVALLVVDVDERADLREHVGDVLHEHLRLILILGAVVVELDEQHPFAGIGVAEHQIAQHPLLRLDVVEGHADFLGIARNLIPYLIVQVIHQPAAVDGVDLVEGAGDVEADARVVARGEVEALVLQLLLGEPPAVAAAELQFVAVFLCLDRTQDRIERRQLDLTDARELVEHLLLFGLQLLLVGQVLPFAAAADAEMLAERSGAHLTLADEAHNAAFGIAVLLLHDLHVDDIAWDAERYEYDQVVVVKQALAFRSNGLDGDAL